MLRARFITRMPLSRNALFDFFDQHGIAHSTVEHPPIFTVEEGRDIKQTMPGGHTKNLFLKDKKGRLALVSALGDTQIAVNQLHRLVDCQRFSFGREELLYEALGVRPGSVTAFSILNDTENRVRFILDAGLFQHEIVNFHPLENTATTAISSRDLLRFARAAGHDPLIIDFERMACVDAPA